MKNKIAPGMKFGRLMAIQFEYVRLLPTGNKKPYWRFKCDCGNEAVICVYSVFSGNTKSCGCYKIERTKEIVTKHGWRHTRLYKTWLGIKDRCNNPNAQYYSLYGGRGIKVCEEWSNSFVSFKDWALDNGYKDNLLIDRIDNDKGYSPSNCRWSTAYEQVHNRRPQKSRYFNGERVSLKKLAKQCGIPYGTFKMRLQMGWSVERAMTQPLEIHRKHDDKSNR